MSIISQLLQAVGSATGSLSLQMLRKMSLTLRNTIAETLFIGIAHPRRTLPPTVKAGEQRMAYNQGHKKVSMAGAQLQSTVQ